VLEGLAVSGDAGGCVVAGRPRLLIRDAEAVLRDGEARCTARNQTGARRD